MKTLRWISFLAVPVLLLVGSGVARAAFLMFDDRTDQVIVVHDNFFECGITFQVNGENAHVDACWISNSPPGYAGTALCYLTEPASDPNAGAISDEIHIQFQVDGNGLAHMAVDFMSDPEGVPPRFPAPGLPVLPEDGTPQLLNFFFFDPATGALVRPPDNIEMRAISDVEEPVPAKPSTWGGIKAIYR